VEIVLDEGVLGVVLETSETGQGYFGFFPPVLRSEPSGGLGDDEDTETERELCKT
jgi:hypothetical protein